MSPTLSQPLEPLTDRELDVLKLLAEGLTNREIADRLILGVETIRWYTKQIYSKLDVHSRTQASRRALEMGLLGFAGGQPTPAPETRPAHNLPRYATSFIGRDDDFNEITRLLRDPNVRLVTIAGPGGAGKTRLSIEVGWAVLDAFADGVRFVSLSTAQTADEIVPAMIKAVDMRVQSDDDYQAQLLHYLESRAMLLVLDNFEHVMDGVDLVMAILEAAPQVNLLVSSHSSLNLQQEWVRQLGSMRYPANPEVDDIAAYSAVQLFVDRVRRIRGDFSLAEHHTCVADICQLVHGMPLAIELAAAWLKTLSCEAVAAEIRQNLDFLATNQPDVDERHRSLRAVFDYSWRLLTDEQRDVFRRLSVFRGGFGRVAAEQIAQASLATLSDLIDRSFVYQNSDGLFEIHDLLRQYAEKQLANTPHGLLTTRSNMLLTWASLIKGQFDKAQELAEAIIATPADKRSAAEEAFGMALLGVLAGMDEDYEDCWQMCEASRHLLAEAPTVQDPITPIFVHVGLGVAGCGLCDYTAARQHGIQALELAKALQSPAFFTLCLPIMAVVLAHDAEPERAIALLALAVMHPASTPAWMEKWPLLVRLQGDLKLDVGPAIYQSLWENGAERALERVVDDLLAVHVPD